MTQRRLFAPILVVAAFALIFGLKLAGQSAPLARSPQGTGQGPGQGNQPAAPAPVVSLPAENYFKNIQILKGVPASQILPTMNFISASLGVQCTFCHVSAQADFDKDDKDEKKTARKMMTMMFDINKNSFNGRRQVTCNSCHNGHSQPQAIPLVASERPAPAPRPAPNPPAANPAPGAPSGASPVAATPPPTVDQIIEKNIQALGGKDAIEKLTSRVVKGNLIVGEFKAPVETYDKAPGKRIMMIHLPQADQIQAYDGSTMWQQGPGMIPEEPQPWQISRAKREADLQAALHLKEYFPRLRLGRIDKVGDRDAYLLIGFPQGDSPVRLYFDKESGLLLRTITVTDTPVGAAPTQVDYEDYRAVNGVQMPFRLRVSRLDTTLVFQLDDIKVNVPVDDSKFVKPAPAGK